MSIFNHFQHLTLSQDQEQALKKIEAFINSPTQVFILKGYAGSGKTTVLKGLVNYLSSKEKEFALLAPTGRAAKVIRERTGQQAFTVHKGIYSYDEMVEVGGGESFFYYYKIRNNPDVANKIFIVDEASMLSDAKSEGEFFRFGTGHLLSDLIAYTRVCAASANSKIIFVGDPCQLPPVGDNNSNALDAAYLSEKFNVNIDQVEMKEVKRQVGESGILKAASKIRKSLSSGFFNDFDLRKNDHDIFNPGYESFLTTWQHANSPKIIIAYKNKTCLDLNLQIRKLKYGNANLPVQKSDIVIMGGNNYRKGVFNGEFAVINEVADVVKTERVKFYKKTNGDKSSEKALATEVTLNWRSVELVFPDAESDNKVVKGQMLENFLYGDNSLKPEEMQALYVDFKNRHKNLKPRTDEFKEAIINDEYFNCLLMKYGYAVTCHKAQGGEWDNVFTVWDHENQKNFDYLKDKQLLRANLNSGFYRWAYTAITRASKQLFAVNPPYFNSYSNFAIIDEAVVSSMNELTGKQLQTEEISLDGEMLKQLSRFGLLDQPLQIQDHFVKVLCAVRTQYIEIGRWEKKSLEISYQFLREGKAAGIKTWINKDVAFNGKYMKLPPLTNSDELYSEVESLLKRLSNISIKRNTTETIISKMEFDFELEEKFPFTRNLFEDLELLLLPLGIVTDNLEHLNYKERYTFKRGTDIAEIDFEYRQNGFWGRVVPIRADKNSRSLLAEIKKVVQTLKSEEYAS